jgi:hypothetical protein
MSGNQKEKQLIGGKNPQPAEQGVGKNDAQDSWKTQSIH